MSSPEVIRERDMHGNVYVSIEPTTEHVEAVVRQALASRWAGRAIAAQARAADAATSGRDPRPYRDDRDEIVTQITRDLAALRAPEITLTATQADDLADELRHAADTTRED